MVDIIRMGYVELRGMRFKPELHNEKSVGLLIGGLWVRIPFLSIIFHFIILPCFEFLTAQLNSHKSLANTLLKLGYDII